MSRRRKITIFSLISIVAIVAALIFFNYPKLTIISGYSAKNMASSVFVAQRDFTYTDTTDNNFGTVDLAEDKLLGTEQAASASVFGLMERKAVYREGLGSVLVTEDFDVTTPYLTPRRNGIANDSLSFPYGNGSPRDTLFPEVNYPKLAKAVEAAFADLQIQRTRAVLVIYKDHILYERYLKGFTKDSKLLGWSMTKSVWATLYGILQWEGKLDIKDKAPVSDWKGDARSQITLDHLLHMNSGLAWDEDYGSISDVTRMLFLAEDMSKIQAEKEAVYGPDEHWNYSSGTTNLLSGILRNYFPTHQEYLDFPYRAFIDRIGMHSMIIEADMSGNYVGSSYAWANVRDWAKFGLLYLHKGNWNGDRLFDESWYNYVTTPAPNSDGRYGGHFWLNSNGYLPDVPKDVFSANGYQGQRVFIVPSKEMVVVRMGLAEGASFDFNTFLSEILDAVE